MQRLPQHLLLHERGDRVRPSKERGHHSGGAKLHRQGHSRRRRRRRRPRTRPTGARGTTSAAASGRKRRRRRFRRRREGRCRTTRRYPSWRGGRPRGAAARRRPRRSRSLLPTRRGSPPLRPLRRWSAFRSATTRHVPPPRTVVVATALPRCGSIRPVDSPRNHRPGRRGRSVERASKKSAPSGRGDRNSNPPRRRGRRETCTSSSLRLPAPRRILAMLPLPMRLES
mmetsp:Transcript_4736/g.13358  ORF Transcript_4736/g.13358 Transcript_4736/m.13358 type:complete len:227 (+) Transcript_4736:699-1379(+)